MFSKILIANRGEIACRIIKTARRMGIGTVAVYSDADEDALHVDMADERVPIGPPPAGESYLAIDTIIDACRLTGAEAVHPGYGFLSENPAFAEALEAAGIVFIGPPKKAISAMGDKIASKKIAQEAGVSTVPGYLGVIEDERRAVEIAGEIGYPVMIKASAGGGGKGMRVAHSAEEVAQGFVSSRNEARSSFGDDRVFIEKFITRPRHIEIQVLADSHGNVIHLCERECSIQRRNQKVIEEAPSPFLDAKTRAEMGAQAVALARAVGYVSAGTVEFIAGADRSFYFLEMNTRLQVEHPVTELITGIDLVEQMIRVAAGEKLQIRQNDVSIKGWAIESRIYAEDPYREFMPSIGRLTRYVPPAEGTENGLTVRNDAGVEEGGEITLYYDPMISKLCTHGPDRAKAIDHMARALDEFHISGIAHNIPFLAAVINSPRFRSGDLTTGFIAEEFPDGFKGAELDDDSREALFAVSAFVHVRDTDRDWSISGQISSWQPHLRREWVVGLSGEEHTVSIERDPDALYITLDDGQTLSVESDWTPGEYIFRGTVNGRPFSVQVLRTDAGLRLVHAGARVEASVMTPRAAQLLRLIPDKPPPDLSKYLLCPMPGLVVSVDAEEGQEVKLGQPLAVVEAMKMENVLRAERDGKVAKVLARPGDSLAVDDVILEF
ncbi:MAG: acetyl-CoA carboxylase biotin carboxylase subunit, partial [Alphaproteobacteria bacterium]